MAHSGTASTPTHSTTPQVPHRGRRGSHRLKAMTQCYPLWIVSPRQFTSSPLPKLPSAMEMANLLVTHIIRLYGIPQDIVSDRGPQFMSQVWKAFCQAKRANRDLETAICRVASRLPSSWATQLPWVKYGHNSLISSTMRMSPFLMNFGYQPPVFPTQETEVAVPSVRAQFRRVIRVWRETRAALGRTAERNQWVGSTECNGKFQH